MTAISPPRYVDLEQLEGEIEAAGMPLPYGLTRGGDELMTCDASGAYVDLPPGAAAVVAAHVPSTAPPPSPTPLP